MTTSYSVFKPKFKKTIADAIYQEVTSGTATYYHWFGKENAWTDFLSPFIGSSATDAPGQPANNLRYDLHVRRDMLTAKKIKPADISYTVPRIDWLSGTVYDQYDDSYGPGNAASGGQAYSGATSLEDSKFYVLTSEYNVYKCIWNNGNSVSIQMPSGTVTDVFQTADGYKWKFMYSIPVSLRNRFLTSEFMPVSNALRAPFYSSGQINNIAIENGGGGYNPATTYALITGDGFSEYNPYILNYIDTTNGGLGYSTTPVITIDPPYLDYQDWSAGLTVYPGTTIHYTSPIDGKDNFYYVISGTTLGTTGPIHTSPGEVAQNGNTQLRYSGTTAVAQAVLSQAVFGATFLDNTMTVTSISSGEIYIGMTLSGTSVETPTKIVAYGTGSGGPGTYIIDNAQTLGLTTVTGVGGAIDHIDLTGNNTPAGYGYQGQPNVTFSTPVNADVTWTPSTVMILGKIVTYNGNYYSVSDITGDNKTGNTAPTHTNGAVANGNVTLNFIAQDPTVIAVVEKTNAAIDLIISPGKDSIFNILVTAGKTKYSEVPTVTLADPPTIYGTTATAYAQINETTGAVTQIIVENVGNGYTTAPTVTITRPKITLDAVTSIDGVTNIITYTSHKFVTGDAVLYHKGDSGNDVIDGLTDGDTYYVYRIDADNFKLAATSGQADSGDTIDIADGTGSNHTLQLTNTNEAATATATLGTGGEIVGYTITDPGIAYTNCNIQIVDGSTSIVFDGALNVDPTTDIISYDPIYTYNGSTYDNLPLSTGDTVVYSNGGGTSVAGLINGDTYYVIKIDNHSIKLALTAADASGGIPINLTDDGAGGLHTLNLTGQGSGAILIADFAVGDVETLQANVELLAIPGAIYTVAMVNGGSGYSSATVNILGDGIGATATATCVGGAVTHVEITNPGSGYSWTDVQITGNVGAVGAVARAIMSPQGGHGSDAISELNANSLVFYTSLGSYLNQGLTINNDYRKVGLIRNVKQFGSNRRFTADIGSGCVLVTGEFDKTKLQYDMLLFKKETTPGVENYKKYRIVEFTDTQILLSVFNNFPVFQGDQFVTDPTDLGSITNPSVQPTTITVTSVSERTFDQFSGDFLFFSVREPYAPSAEQIITVRTTLTV